MSQTGKLMPNLDQQNTKMLNLTVLQRMDPFIEEILITAAHVTFYEFNNIGTNQWSRKDVEGSLFVVKRNTQPRFQFIVMNRRNTAMSLGNNTSNAAAPRQPYHSSAAVALTPHATVAAYTHIPTPLVPILSLPVSSAPTTLQAPMTVYDTTNSVSSNQVTNLVNPFTFFTPPSSSALTASTNSLHPPLNLQRPYGTPMLQPFPPPTPPLSLTPSTTLSVNDLPAINRDKIRDAILILAQDNQLIDMFHKALLKVHQS